MAPLHPLHPQCNPNHLCFELDYEDACAYTACNTDYNDEEKVIMEKMLLEMRAKAKEQYDLKFNPLFESYQ